MRGLPRRPRLGSGPDGAGLCPAIETPGAAVQNPPEPSGRAPPGPRTGGHRIRQPPPAPDAPTHTDESPAPDAHPHQAPAAGPLAAAHPISGRTRILPHLGLPTESFRAPMIYNPWFRAAGVDAVVVPMGCAPGEFAALLPLLARLTNFAGALVTMPHKVAAAGLLDRASPAVRVCGACNAVRRDPDGLLSGDMFDGAGFVRGLERRGRTARGASALVVGAGGVGSAIAAALAASGAARLGLVDAEPGRAEALAARLRAEYPGLALSLGSADPAGWEVTVNATPLGMRVGDPLPFDAARLDPGTLVGEVVLSPEETPLLAAARARGCPVQVGTDMLFEQIPAYLEFFGLPVAPPDRLRALAEFGPEPAR